MAAITADVEGAFIALVSTPYAFTDQSTGEQRKGTSHRLWLSTSTDEPPTEITVQDGSALLPELVNCEEFDVLACRCSVFANIKGGRAVQALRLDSFTPQLIAS